MNSRDIQLMKGLNNSEKSIWKIQASTLWIFDSEEGQELLEEMGEE